MSLSENHPYWHFVLKRLKVKITIFPRVFILVVFWMGALFVLIYIGFVGVEGRGCFFANIHMDARAQLLCFALETHLLVLHNAGVPKM